MPSFTIGQRTLWPSPQSVFHWELRKRATLPNYRSTDFEGIIRGLCEFAQINLKHPDTDYPERLEAILSMKYNESCFGQFGNRIQIYERMLPPDNYRRTSENVSISIVEDPTVEAYAAPSDSHSINIHYGFALAIEDATHSLIADWIEPFALQFPTQESQSLRKTLKNPHKAFVDYSPIENAQHLTLFNNRGIEPREEGIFDGIPRCVFDRFLALSFDEGRQSIADHLSEMSYIWVISHEDAHCYSGHINYFCEDIGIGGEDVRFDEFQSPTQDPSYLELRRAAELEADMCATMRAVDCFFDDEFVSFMEHTLPLGIRHQIHEGADPDSGGFGRKQRLMVMRMITFSSLIPILIFERRKNEAYSNHDTHYPSFMTRALNIIFTVASKCIDTPIHNPHYNVGEFAISEIPKFFEMALYDLGAFMNYFDSSKTQKAKGLPTAAEIEELWDSGNIDSWMEEFVRNNTTVAESTLPVEKLASCLTVAFFGAHGQAQQLLITEPVPETFVSDDMGAIRSLLSSRKSMLLARVTSFANSKFSVNPSRADKVTEDIELSQKSISDIAKAFPYI